MNPTLAHLQRVPLLRLELGRLDRHTVGQIDHAMRRARFGLVDGRGGGGMSGVAGRHKRFGNTGSVCSSLGEWG